MKLLYKDQLKKIKYNLFNFISLSLLVILISLTFTAAKQSISRLDDNYDEYMETQQVETFQFSMASVDIDYLGGTAILYLCEELDIEFECYYNISIGTPAAYNNLNHIINNKIDEQPELLIDVIDTYVENLENEYDFIIEKKNFSDVTDGVNSYRFVTLTTEIDIPYLVDGILPVEDYEIAVFPEFAENNDIKINDTLTINGTDYIVTAFVYSPDYVFPIYYMNSMDLEYDTLVVTNNNTIELLDNHINRKYVARGELSDILDAKTYKEVNETDTSALGKTTQIKSIKPAIANYAISTLPIEVENANIFIDAFLTLFISFIALLLTIFLKRYIDKNKKDIETLQALGFSDTELTKSLMVFPVIVSLMTIVGFILGLIISSSLFDLYGGRYLFPKADFRIYYIVIQNAIILPVLFINSISFIFIRLSLRKDKKQSPKFKSKLLKYTPLKTILSSSVLLTIISVMIIFGMNGNSMFNEFGPHTKEGNNFFEMLQLDYYTDEAISDDYETFTREGGKISLINGVEPSKKYGVRVYGINPDNSLKLLIDNDPLNNLLLEDGVIISEYVQYNLGIDVGDEIVLTIDEQDLTYTVVGISNELIENNVFIKKVDLNAVYSLSNDYYNGVYTTDDLYDSAQIARRINYQEGLDGVIQTLRASAIVVNFLLILSIVLALLVFALIIINYLSDNRLNISILKSIGFNNYEINKKYLWNIYLTFVISYIISVPLTYLLFDLLIKTLIDGLGYILIVNVSEWYIVIGFLILNAIFISTTYFVTRYYEKISISEILKYNIK